MFIDTIENLKHWTEGVEVEQPALAQLRNLAALSILAGHVAGESSSGPPAW
jgi:hypothetical protein